MRRNVFALLIAFSFFACQQKETKEEGPIEMIGAAHQKSAFLANDLIRFHLNLYFGGKERLNADITVMTNSSKAIIEINDSTKIVVVGSDVYHTPSYEKVKSVRFDAYTWTYFMLFPYKLSDPGTKWSKISVRELNGVSYNFLTLTFEANTGDAPDDWYKVYSNQETNLIHAAAYIVTAGKTKDEAEEDPHAIVYSNYKKINEIPIATNWTFWGWRMDEGLTNQLGQAELSEIEFLNQEEVSFDVPSSYIKSNRN
jgi:hypothetical protein